MDKESFKRDSEQLAKDIDELVAKLDDKGGYSEVDKCIQKFIKELEEAKAKKGD